MEFGLDGNTSGIKFGIMSSSRKQFSFLRTWVNILPSKIFCHKKKRTIFTMYCRCKIKAVLTCWCCAGRRRGPRRRGPSPTSGSRGGTTCLQVDIWIIMADIREKKSRLYGIWFYSQPHPKTEEFMDNPCCSMKRPLTPCQHQTAAPTWGPPVTAAPYSLLEDRQCSVVGGDCICSWTAHYAVPYLALLRHRKKYENMIYSSGLGPSWDQAGTGNTNVNLERDISTATAAPPAILQSICPKRMVQLSPVRPFLD